MKNNTKIYELIILGAGPGGMTAAIYAKRAEVDVMMIDKSAPGGKMVKTSEIENYPGYTSILGPDLSMNMFNQTQNLKITLNYGDISNIELENNYKVITSVEGNRWKTKSIIIATGTLERKLNVPGEDHFYGHGVSYCAVCDGAFFKEQNIAVVGGGNAAVEESLYLTKFAKEVFLIHRRQGFRAEKGMLLKAQNHQKITFILDSIVEEIIGTEKVEKIKIKNVISNLQTEIDVKAIFPYIGAIPNTDFIKNLEILDQEGYILVNEYMETNISGIFAVGDVRKTILRQITTAVGDGAIAAQRAVNYLDSFK